MGGYGILAALAFVVVWGLAGCRAASGPESERSPIDFTVVEQRKLPEELWKIIEENKENEIRMTYEDGEELYLVRGYGVQKTGGYSIAVEECTEDEKTVWFGTKLLGPPGDAEYAKEPSYPYLVVKMEMRDKEVQIR